MKRIYLVLIVGILLIGSVSALDSLGTFKQNENIRVTQVCSDATYINITSISYPNSTVAVSGIQMTNAGSGEFYYDFSSTELLGRYDVRQISDGCEETFATYFEITSSGDSFNLSQAVIILGMFGFMALLFGISYAFSKEKWKIKSFFHISALLIGIVLLNSIRILMGTSSNLASMGNMGLIIGIIILSFMILYIMLLYTIEVFNYFKKRNRDKWEIGDSYE